ncbi:MAG TPA: histidine kinase [Nocardioides sp.]|nr:histidine kinase [Nocardioides sp.]
MSAIRALGVRLRERFEEKSEQHGLVYPWWIAVIGGGGQVLCVMVAVGQRGLLSPLDPAALAIVLVVVPQVAQASFRTWVPWWVDTVFVLAAVGWLMTIPFEAQGPENMAPAAAIFLAASVTATDGPRAGLLTTVASIAVVLVGNRYGDSDPSIDIYVVEIIGGFVVGYMLRWQMRALAAERRERAQERERATLAERQRIAREIHDLVAHSLSVTMLHVTGAKQALVEDRDVDDAVAALADAEQVGRQAMAEIRRTVSVLATEPTGAHPLPCAEDIDALVAQVRDAGLPVDYASRGDLTRLSPAIGLGMYRILQESLTNVAKHAPGETAEVRVDVGRARARLNVRNQRPGRSIDPDGSGTSGMASRADQIGGTFRAGPDETDPRRWVVELDVPVDDAHCVVKKVWG